MRPALRTPRPPLRAVVHGPGTALRLRVSELRRQFLSSPSLLKMLHRYQYVLMAQLSTSAACAHFHAVEVRLATFLLMAHDRAQADRRAALSAQTVVECGAMELTGIAAIVTSSSVIYLVWIFFFQNMIHQNRHVMPLVLLALHRLFTRHRWRDASSARARRP